MAVDWLWRPGSDGRYCWQWIAISEGGLIEEDPEAPAVEASDCTADEEVSTTMELLHQEILTVVEFLTVEAATSTSQNGSVQNIAVDDLVEKFKTESKASSKKV